MFNRMISVILLLAVTVTMVFSLPMPEADASGSWELPFSDFEWEVLRLVNRERAEQGLHPLAGHGALQKAADIRAEEIYQAFVIVHSRPDGRSYDTVLDEVEYPHSTSGENIAAGQSTPADVMSSWMESSGHRWNILRADVSRIGIGETNLRWVQLFADGPAFTSLRVLTAENAVYALGTNLEDMQLLAILDSEIDESYLPLDAAWCSGFDPQKEGTQEVTLEVFGLRCTFSVTLGTHVHQWQEASCAAPKHCLLCGETEGEMLPHTWLDATCDTPKTCAVCGVSQGYATGLHSYLNDVCVSCGNAVPDVSILGNDHEIPIPPDFLHALGTLNEARIANGAKPLTCYAQLQYAAQEELITYCTASEPLELGFSADILRNYGIWTLAATILYVDNQPSAEAAIAEILADDFRRKSWLSDSYSHFAIAQYGDRWNLVLIHPLIPAQLNRAYVLPDAAVFEVGTGINDMNLTAAIVWKTSVYYLPVTESLCSGYDPELAGEQTVSVSALGVGDTFRITLQPHQHSRTYATSQSPKTCSVCGETEGNPTEHNFVDGKCGMCGALERKLGDADGNGILNYSDALLILRASIGLETLPQEILDICDVSGDGIANYSDALLILRFSIGLITEFPRK